VSLTKAFDPLPRQVVLPNICPQFHRGPTGISEEQDIDASHCRIYQHSEASLVYLSSFKVNTKSVT
jgi:hypothetical protein